MSKAARGALARSALRVNPLGRHRMVPLQRSPDESDVIVWRSATVHDCPLCGVEVRPARTRANVVVLLTGDGGRHPIICGGLR